MASRKPAVPVEEVEIPLHPELRGEVMDELIAELKHRVIGQDAAVESVVEICQMHRVGLQPEGRPIASLLFLGPTGTGKTHMVESLAEILIGDKRALLKVDCAEFQHGHEIAKLIGSPPGYLGHRETHPLLSQENLNRYHTDSLKLSLVLFDEIEKASDTLWNLLLGIMDKATLTLGDNRNVDFSHTIIFMTSNLGSREIEKLNSPAFGFTPLGEDGPADRMEHVGFEAARRKFTPEFFNRIDKSIVFHPLEKDDLYRILDLELMEVQHRIIVASMERLKAPRFLLRVNPSARDFLIAEGTDARYGARHLKRTIEKYIVHPLANLLSSGQVLDESCLNIREIGGKLVFSRGTAC